MLHDYFKTNPGLKVLPWRRIEPQFPSPVVIVMSYNDPNTAQYLDDKS